MNQLPKTSPEIFCSAFINRELSRFKKDNIYGSYWPVMDRLVRRSEELFPAYDELIQTYGYNDVSNAADDMDKREAVWLILEHIWSSVDYSKREINNSRDSRKNIEKLNDRIILLTEQLSEALKDQSALYEESGFIRQEYQSALSVLEHAGSSNSLYLSYISKKIKLLKSRFDLKYWPDRSDLVDAIGEFEKNQSRPRHFELSESVLNGRESIAKDFVISFDNGFNGCNSLPVDFRFSNKAMASILNVVLNIDSSQLVDDTTIRIVRNRYKD